MIKLTEAKCPSCGANIEVNKDLEKSICQYCGNTILIEEAIQKVQLSGKVEVEGIVSLNNKLDNAKKYIKINEYNEAKKIIDVLLKEYPFDENVLELLLEINIKLFNFDSFDSNSSIFSCQYDWDSILYILKFYDRFNKTAKKELDSELKEKLDKMVEWNNTRLEDEKKCKKISTSLNNYMQENFDTQYFGTKETPFHRLFLDINLNYIKIDGTLAEVPYSVKTSQIKTFTFKNFEFHRDYKVVALYENLNNKNETYTISAQTKKYSSLDEFASILEKEIEDYKTENALDKQKYLDMKTRESQKAEMEAKRQEKEARKKDTKDKTFKICMGIAGTIAVIANIIIILITTKAIIAESGTIPAKVFIGIAALFVEGIIAYISFMLASIVGSILYVIVSPFVSILAGKEKKQK